MARSPFTLAAAVTAALPGSEVIAVRPLSAGGESRFDSAVATLEGGREITVRASTDDEGAAELAAEAMALRALSAGARAVLPFAVPDYIGETRMGDAGNGTSRVLAAGFLPGFQIAAADIPAGRGAAESVGSALAAVHTLPPSVVRSAGLPERSAQEARTQLRRLVDRASATGRVPARLTVRWRAAMDRDELWLFEPTVVIGGAQATSFLFADDPEWGPQVTGVIGWHGLSIADPAMDLAWLSSAPQAQPDIQSAYLRGSGRSPDAAMAVRARLRAELEFAQWLVHGEEQRRSDIVDDAAGLLEALAEGLRNDDLAVIQARGSDVEQAMNALDRVPADAAASIDTSMQTDTYDPGSLWAGSDTDPAAQETSELDVSDSVPNPAAEPHSLPVGERERPADLRATAPVFDPPTASNWDFEEAAATESADAADNDAQRAARAALNRWSRSSSE